jgi:diguanylate cyclase (GGDEF)-like protein
MKETSMATVNPVFDTSDPYIDAVSGLPGPNVSSEIFQEATDNCFPILLIDIDDLRAVNSIFTSRAGDRVISDLGAMIRIAFPDNPIGRKGGDEFVVIFDDDGAESREKAYEIIDHAARYLTVRSPSGCRYSVTISAGFGRGFMDPDRSLPTCEYLVNKAKLSKKNGLALLVDNECVFRPGPELLPGARKYLGDYSFQQTKHLVDVFKWYHGLGTNNHFDDVLDQMFRKMNPLKA